MKRQFAFFLLRWILNTIGLWVAIKLFGLNQSTPDNVATITGSDGTITITSDSDTKPDGATNTLKQELTETISKEKVPMTSKDLKSKTIKFTITNGKVSDYNAS